MKQAQALDVPQMNLSFADEDFDHEQYEAVANRARLHRLGLQRQAYKAELSLLWPTGEGGGSLKHAFKGIPKGHVYNRERGLILGKYEWSVQVKHGRRNALKAVAEYMLMFGGLEACKSGENYVALYFEKIARFASYPYFRSHFAMCTANSGITLPPLPTLTERVD